MSLRGLEHVIRSRGYRILYTTGKADHPDFDLMVVDALFPNGKIKATVSQEVKARGAVSRQSDPDDIKAAMLAKLEELTRPVPPPPPVDPMLADTPEPDIPITTEEEPLPEAKKRKGKK
jgi:hypothetical protein